MNIMKTLHIIILILFLCFLFVSFTWADDAKEKAKEETVPPKKVAILPFLNRASEQLAPVVGAIPEMLAIKLNESKKLLVIKQTQIKKILEDFSPSLSEIPINKINAERIAELGKKLDTDILIAGSFIESDGLQIETKIYDAKSGKLLSKHSAVGDKTKGIALVNKMAEDLSKALIGSKLEQMPPKKVAVLYFRNNLSEDYDAFTASMPIMIMATLKKLKGVILIEQTEVQKYLKDFKLEKDGVMDAEKAVQLGGRLNADVLILGSFSMSEGIYQLTGVFVDAKTGKIVDKQSVKGDEKDIMSLPAQLGEKMKVTWEKKRITDLLAMGKLEVQFRITFTAMTERKKHFHICKLFVDGKYIETSKPVKKLGTWLKLFSTQIQAGEHDIEIVHGSVRKVKKDDSWWLKRFYTQPKKWHVRINLKTPTIIKYEFHVGWAKDEFRYPQK